MLKRLLKYGLITAGLEASWLASRAGLMARARGRGAIFTLHHVRPPQPAVVRPNGHLEISPAFLDAAILSLKADGYRFVSLSEVPDLLDAKEPAPPFAAFTLDDGYRDNRDHALPVFECHGVPFTIFVCKGFSERSHSIWWETADRMVNGKAPIEIETDGGTVRHALETPRQRIAACDAICDPIGGPDEARNIARLDRAASKAGIDALALVGDLVMDADELAALSGHPLVTLGAHTVSHRGLVHLDAETLAAEIAGSADYVEAITGRRPAVFAYPYGDARSVGPAVEAELSRAGFAVAVTTRPGTLKPLHLASPLRLPRISLNGYYQRARYAAALASGLPFRLTGR